MTHEINIYGDIVPFKWMNDGSEFDLSDINNLLSALSTEKDDEVIVNIHTFGGCTTTAFAIYNKLQRFASEKSVSLTTRIDGWCASSGVILLLAGDKRIGNQFAEPFVHNAWTISFITDKNEAEKIAEDLTKVDNQIATLYSQRTSISKEDALNLMNSDTFISADECLSYGFYTELENVYASENSMIFNSLRNQNNTLRNSKNTNMSKDKSFWNKLKKDIDSFLGTETKNKIVFTADNAELDFYELDSEATPVIGDKAKFDGKPAGETNGGEYVMSNGDTYKFVGEELTEITPKADEAPAVDEEKENLISENADLKTQVETLNKKIAEATTIINKFKAIEADDEPTDEERNPKPTEAPTSIRNYFKNIK